MSPGLYLVLRSALSFEFMGGRGLLLSQMNPRISSHFRVFSRLAEVVGYQSSLNQVVVSFAFRRRPCRVAMLVFAIVTLQGVTSYTKKIPPSLPCAFTFAPDTIPSGWRLGKHSQLGH